MDSLCFEKYYKISVKEDYSLFTPIVYEIELKFYDMKKCLIYIEIRNMMECFQER